MVDKDLAAGQAICDSLVDDVIVTLFHAGADAYLKKPIDIPICAAQARALIRLYFLRSLNALVRIPAGEQKIVRLLHNNAATVPEADAALLYF